MVLMPPLMRDVLSEGKVPPINLSSDLQRSGGWGPDTPSVTVDTHWLPYHVFSADEMSGGALLMSPINKAIAGTLRRCINLRILFQIQRRRTSSPNGVI